MKRRQRSPGSYAGAALITGILISTWWVPGLRSTLIAGGPWLGLLALGYWLTPRPPEPAASVPEAHARERAGHARATP